MKKWVSLFCFLLLVPSFLFSAPLVSVGEGGTKEDAKTASLDELVSSLASYVSSSSLVTTKDDAKGNESSSFRSLISSGGDAVLIGAEYAYKKKSGGYLCTVTIGEENRSAYETSAKSLLSSIKSLNASRLSSRNDSEKVSIDLRLLEAISQYDSVRMIAKRLGSPSSFASSPVDYETVRVEFNRLRPYYSDADIQSLLLDSTEAMDRIAADHAAMLREDQIERKRKEDEARVLKEKLDEETSRLVAEEALKANNAYASLQSVSDDVLSDLQSIQQDRVLYASEMKKWDRQYQELESQRTKAEEQARSGILSASWSAAEMEGGKVAEEARRIRSSQADDAVSAASAKYDESADGILTEQARFQDSYAETIEKKLDRMAEKSYRVNSKDEKSLSYEIGSYSPEMEGWPVFVRLDIAGTSIPCEVALDYTRLSKKEIPASWDTEKYDTFKSDVDTWDAFFASTDHPLLLEATYRTEGSLETSSLTLPDVQVKVFSTLEPDRNVGEWENSDEYVIAVKPDIPVEYSHYRYDRTDERDAKTEKRQKSEITANASDDSPFSVSLLGGISSLDGSMAWNAGAGVAYRFTKLFGVFAAVDALGSKDSFALLPSAGASCSFRTELFLFSLRLGAYAGYHAGFAYGGALAVSAMLSKVPLHPLLQAGMLLGPKEKVFSVSIGVSF